MELSLIIPVYNCEDWILDNLSKIQEYLSKKTYPWELIIIDDCSKDETSQKIQSHLYNMTGTVFIGHAKNQGKGGAVLSGFRSARGQFRIFTDCDLTYPLSEIDKILEALRGDADMAIANRRHPNSICELKPAFFSQVYSRELYGKMLNSFMRLLGLTDVPDTQAGLKGVKGWLVPHLNIMRILHFGFDVELLLLAKSYGANIESVPVRYQYFENESTVHVFRDGIRFLLDILYIKRCALRGYYKTEADKDKISKKDILSQKL